MYYINRSFYAKIQELLSRGKNFLLADVNYGQDNAQTATKGWKYANLEGNKDGGTSAEVYKR